MQEPTELVLESAEQQSLDPAVARAVRELIEHRSVVAQQLRELFPPRVFQLSQSGRRNHLPPTPDDLEPLAVPQQRATTPQSRSKDQAPSVASVSLRYPTRMKPDTEQSSEFEKFTSLVDSVLSVPKMEVDKRISEERRLKDLEYLKQDIEAADRRKSQIIPSK